MYFGILFTTLMVGGFLMGFCGLMPLDIQVYIPGFFRIIIFFVGMLVPLIGILLLKMRCARTGAEHLINPARPGTVLWFYFYRDGEMRITPSIRTGEGQLYSRELDSQVFDVKNYSIADHKFRIVPEVVGHAVDIDYVFYVNLLKSRWGYENLKEVRAETIPERVLGKIGVKRTREIMARENIAVGREEIGNVQRRISGDIIPRTKAKA